ncbi:MAG: T9SS type A sorting domain-containing protein [bacterium]
MKATGKIEENNMINIYNLEGKQVYREQFRGGIHTLYKKNFIPGVYLVEVNGENTCSSMLIVE